MGHKGTTVARDAVDRTEQLPHMGDDRDLRPLAGTHQALVVRRQPSVSPDGDQCRHPEPMAHAAALASYVGPLSYALRNTPESALPDCQFAVCRKLAAIPK